MGCHFHKTNLIDCHCFPLCSKPQRSSETLHSSVARQVRDTAIQAERVADLNEKLKDSVQDLRVVSEENGEMKHSMRDLQHSVSMLQGASLECQHQFEMEKERAHDALKLQGEANANTHAWIAHVREVEDAAQASSDEQWEAVERAEESAAALRQENEAMNESVRSVLQDAQSELNRETIKREAAAEVMKFSQDKAHQARGELAEAESHLEEATAEKQMLRQNLDHTRVIKKQYKDESIHGERLHYAEKARGEKLSTRAIAVRKATGVFTAEERQRKILAHFPKARTSSRCHTPSAGHRPTQPNRQPCAKRTLPSVLGSKGLSGVEAPQRSTCRRHMPSLLVGDCQVKHPKDLPLESAHSNAAGEAAAARHQSTGVLARAGSSNDAGHQRSQKPSSRVMDNDCSTPGERAAPVVAPDKKASESWCAFWQRWQKWCKGSEYSKAACLSEWKSLPEIARDEFKAAHGFK